MASLYDRMGLTLEMLEANFEADRLESIALWEKIADLPAASTLRIRLPRDYVPPPKKAP